MLYRSRRGCQCYLWIQKGKIRSILPDAHIEPLVTEAGAAHGTFIVAMEAKRRGLSSSAEPQLLTYLAILRELRIRAGKTNAVARGFSTDGYRYRFMAIDADG